ncbi:MAG: stage III sporulation protein AE [Lachnospiraceae bacterium]|nr:stage III sporulation protein AE [Lachnospiraceae bacterium]
MRGVWLLAAAILCLLFGAPRTVYAQSTTGEENDVLSGEEGLLEEMDLDQVQKAVDELLEDENLSFRGLVGELLRGEKPFSIENVKTAVFSLLDSSWKTQRKLWVNLLVLVLAASLFANLSGVLDSGQLGEMSFFFVYLCIFVLLIKNFSVLSGEIADTLSGIVTFMRALAPAYFLSVAAASGASTATAFYQVILLGITAVEHLLLYLVLPGIHVFLLLSLVNHLSKEDFLSRMAELLKNIICWTLQGILGILAGLQILQSLVAPALDSLRRTAIGRTAGSIPGVGNAINAVTELVIGSAALIRNCVGVAAVLVLLLFALRPLLHVALTGLAYRLLSAVIQPVADMRMVGALQATGEGCGLLLKVLFTTELLFLLTIAIVAAAA